MGTNLGDQELNDYNVIPERVKSHYQAIVFEKQLERDNIFSKKQSADQERVPGGQETSELIEHRFNNLREFKPAGNYQFKFEKQSKRKPYFGSQKAQTGPADFLDSQNIYDKNALNQRSMKCLVNMKKQSPRNAVAISPAARARSFSPRQLLENGDRVLIRTFNNLKDKI